MKVYLETYGCTANKADSNIIIGILKENKHKIVESMDQADLLILNTCTVIDTTEQRMLSRLREYKKTKKPIIVAGCMATIQQNTINSITPKARFLPPQHVNNIIDVIKNNKAQFTEENKTQLPKHYNDINAPIQIAEGCMQNCSYCITRLARGKLNSYPINEIKQDIKNALKQDCKEIYLTAQDTASYGLDVKTNLGELITAINEIKEDFRVRIGMMNPYTLQKNLQPILSAYNHQKIYKFLHIPVQSGDNHILQKMNRKYTIEEFKEIIKKFKTKYPNITISTDIIVGFPSETEKQFQNTIDLLKQTKPDIINITRYSARPYTKAKTMKNRIPTDIAKQRSTKLTKICKQISVENNKKHINKTYNILITEQTKNNISKGRTENYKPTVIKNNLQIGTFHQVKITNATNTHLVGNLI